MKKIFVILFIVCSSSLVFSQDDSYKELLVEFMKSQGIPNEPDVMKPEHTTVFSFPMKTAKDAMFRTSMSAIEQ